ncbi:MAG: Hsp20/alpha crystallin family protein [Proteobacteria bacterium]|nr:Hsp20/alpha crystallin family protein [Pseudomonadota bacterium]
MLVRAEIAGVKGDELKVSVDGSVLRLSGVRRVPAGKEDVRRLHQMEIAFGAFERTIRIRIPFEADQVSAHLEDGFLEVTLPKRLPAARRVEVETG